MGDRCFWCRLRVTFGTGVAFGTFVHAMLEEYVPFIVLLTALYTVAGGICVRGNLHGTPRLNTAILALGTVLASIMGTTGAAMLLIRPLLRANDNRKHVVHVVVFFIFLVANAGGSLSPLGDPPLFLGFLNGVSFFWTTTHLALPMLFVCVVLLVDVLCAGFVLFTIGVKRSVRRFSIRRRIRRCSASTARSTSCCSVR